MSSYWDGAFARDVQNGSAAVGHTAVALFQLLEATGQAVGEGMAYLWSDSPPDRSQEIPLESYMENGRPVVRWIAEHGNDWNEWSETHWYEVVTIEQFNATVCPRGRLIVTRMKLYAECRWREVQHSGEPQSLWGMPQIEPEIQVVCDLPAAALRSFTRESSSSELSPIESAKLRAGRFLYTEHQCIRATFAGGETGVLSVCQRNPQHAQDVVFALNRMFTGKRFQAPSDEWRSRPV